jgi:hypothetical protein
VTSPLLISWLGGGWTPTGHLKTLRRTVRRYTKVTPLALSRSHNHFFILVAMGGHPPPGLSARQPNVGSLHRMTIIFFHEIESNFKVFFSPTLPSMVYRQSPPHGGLARLVMVTHRAATNS